MPLLRMEGGRIAHAKSTSPVPKARQSDVCDRIAKAMAMQREDYEYQTIVFPKTGAERRRDQRKLEVLRAGRPRSDNGGRITLLEGPQRGLAPRPDIPPCPCLARGV